jgi:hypothetical protein
MNKMLGKLPRRRRLRYRSLARDERRGVTVTLAEPLRSAAVAVQFASVSVATVYRVAVEGVTMNAILFSLPEKYSYKNAWNYEKKLTFPLKLLPSQTVTA